MPRSLPAVAIASRAAAALVGGYALATAASVLFAALLPGGRGDGVLAGMLLSFSIYAAAALWAFAARSAGRAWLGIALSALACAALSWALIGAAR